MELPDICPACHYINMVNWERLETRLVSKLYTVQGYKCAGCGKWKPSYYTTRQVDENMRKLCQMRPDHPSFYYHFVKAYNRSVETQVRGRNASTHEPHHRN